MRSASRECLVSKCFRMSEPEGALQSDHISFGVSDSSHLTGIRKHCHGLVLERHVMPVMKVQHRARYLSRRE